MGLFRWIEALGEFNGAVNTIKPVMTDPNTSKEQRRETLCVMADELSEYTFDKFVGKIMVIINMKEDVCSEYKNTEAQVTGILKWIPRMERHIDKLTKKVKENRNKYGLKV